MYRQSLLAAFLITCLALATTARADTLTSYTIDPNHTQVVFSWHHFGFSTPSAMFSNIQGTVLVDEDTPANSSVNVSIPVKSLDTGVPVLNEHLLTKPQYFKADKFPEITFKSTEIRNVERNDNEFDLVGTLTINGISKQVVLEAKVNKVGTQPMWGNAPAIGVSAETTIKRSDFGMGAFVPAVSDALEVDITLEAIETSAYNKVQQGQ